MTEFVKGDRVQTKYEEEGEIIAVFLAPDMTWLWLKFDHSDHPVTRKATVVKKVPTNEEKLLDLIHTFSDRPSSTLLAKYLDEKGVQAP